MNEVLEGLRQVREAMADPDNVVKNPDSLIEYDDDRNVRRCVVAHCFAVGSIGGQLCHELERHSDHRDLTAVLRAGDHLKVIDAAIADAEGKGQ